MTDFDRIREGLEAVIRRSSLSRQVDEAKILTHRLIGRSVVEGRIEVCKQREEACSSAISLIVYLSDLVKRFANEEWSADYPVSSGLYPTMEEIAAVVGEPPRGLKEMR